MTENNRHLPFSQRNGLVPIPQLLKLGEISDEFRNELYNLIHQFLEGNINYNNEIIYMRTSTKRQTLRSVHRNVFKRTIDEIDDRGFNVISFYKKHLLDDEYNVVFDVIEHIMRVHNRLDFDFVSEFKRMFNKHALAYTIIDEKCPTIVPAASPEEGEAIRQAFEAAEGDKYAAVREHLRNSAEQINANLPADAIRESIHAVESVLRIVTGESDFNKALQKLETSHRIHPALKDAFKKLYAYTSDEQGIRHALVDQPASPAGMDEAVFMLGTCAAFVGYVIRKS